MVISKRLAPWLTSAWLTNACPKHLLLVFLVSMAALAQAPGTGAPLSGDEVVRRMVARNQQRAAALHSFRGTRVYRVEYQGFLVNKEAEMVTTIVYQSPDSKQFTEVSESGSKLLVDRVLRKLLESEQEASKAENRARTALNTDNYRFTLTGYEPAGSGANYVFEVEPRSSTKFLYRGKIWVDAQDFAVSRMEVEPAKSPSFWTKKSDISHVYEKVDGFWLPKQNRSVSAIRLGGRAVLTIDYNDYKILDPVAQQSGGDAGRIAQAAR